MKPIIKRCFKCKGLGVVMTATKLKRLLAKEDNPKKRAFLFASLRNPDKNKCACRYCEGNGVLSYPKVEAK